MTASGGRASPAQPAAPPQKQKTSGPKQTHAPIDCSCCYSRSDDATALIHTTARGYPRAVNNLALQALVATYAAGKAIVDENAARAAVTEVTDT